MKKVLVFVSLFPILPTIVLAQTLSAQGFVKSFLAFSNKTLIPALIGIAFLLFVINVIRFFVIQGGEEDGRENAKNLAVYSVLAFVVLIVFWGVVNLFANSLGFSGKGAPTPDYLQLNGKEFKNAPGSPTRSTDSPCTALQQDFDNEFGGPCAGAKINSDDRSFFEKVFDGVVGGISGNGSTESINTPSPTSDGSVENSAPNTDVQPPTGSDNESTQTEEDDNSAVFTGDGSTRKPCNSGETRGLTRC